MGKIFDIEFAKYGSIPKGTISVRANSEKEALEIAKKRRWAFINKESYRQETGKRLRMENKKKSVTKKKPTARTSAGKFPTFRF